jgi:hypothetical protein
LVVVAALFWPMTVSASEEQRYQLQAVTSPGDWFKFELISNEAEDWKEAFSDEDNTVQAVQINGAAEALMEHISDNCENVDPTGCSRLRLTMSFNHTLIFESGSDYDDDTVVISSALTSILESNGTHSWMMDTMTMDVWMSVDGESYHVEIVDEEVNRSVSDSDPLSVSLGDSWIIRENGTTQITSKSRTNGGDWEFESSVETYEKTTNYNAVSIATVYVGTRVYDCIKIEDQVIGESEKGIGYHAWHGLPTKMEMYDEDGELEMMMLLSEYSWANEPTKSTGQSEVESGDGGMVDIPFPGIVSTTVVFLVTAIILRRSNQE